MPAMEWEVLHHSTGEVSLVTYGRRDRYAVVVAQAPDGSPSGVTLTRWPIEHAAHDPYMQGAAAARNAIVFPLGRGPGRPAGEPELDALLSCAKVYAEAYEAGEDLSGYSCWQHQAAPAGNAAFLASGDPHDCRHC